MMEMERENEFLKIESIFTVEDENIEVYELQSFLKYFNIVYLKALDVSERIGVSKVNYSTNEEFNQNVKLVLLRTSLIENKSYHTYLENLSSYSNNLVICELDKHSPLNIVFGGSIVALSVALILAGGKLSVEVEDFKFEVKIDKSLGESIEDLKKIFDK